MIPELGLFALIVALAIAVAQWVVPCLETRLGATEAARFARAAAPAQFAFVAIAFGCLATSFLTNDFSVANVVAHSQAALPAHYRFAATWGSHEGSMLLWVLILAGWSTAVALRSAQLPERLAARVLGVLGFVATGLIAFVLLTSNPFERAVPPALDGRDLNPLLQDPGMVFHPPLLYMGYVGFAVSFAFALAALLDGRLDAAWARWSRPWTLAAWSFLTLGIAIGSFWAYYELGWGGWWFWDPVENASLIPWLAGTALVHSLAVTEKRGVAKAWTAVLAIATFSLSLLGTFLVRSGVLSSVHTFANDPRRGVFVLVLLGVVVGGSLAIFALRAGRLKPPHAIATVSREAALLGNNVLLASGAATVLLGTLYPLILDALGLGKISVGPPYFESVLVPLLTVLVVLLGIGVLAPWRLAAPREIAARLAVPALGAALAGALVPIAVGSWSLGTVAGGVLAGWILTTTGASIVARLVGEGMTMRRRLDALLRSRSFLGMHLAHVGVAVFVLGVTIVRSTEVDHQVRLGPGDSVMLAGYRFRLEGVAEHEGPNYRAARGSVSVAIDTERLATLHPEKRFYFSGGQAMTEAAIDYGVLRHLYVALGEPLAGNAWSVRVQVKPLVGWIWGGCLLMALGGALAISDRRYRLRTTKPLAVPASLPAT